MDLVALDQEGYLAFYERREIDGELKLMPPQRIFFSAHDTPSAYESGHQPVNVGTPGRPEELATYNEDGQLAYIGRNRRPATPLSVNSIFILSRIAEIVRYDPDDAVRASI